MNSNMSAFRSIVEKEQDGKETVSFNYPKYEEKGTPYEVWSLGVNKVEEALERIIEDQPWREEFPLIHLRREEKDESGRVIRVHLELYGRISLVRVALTMLRKAEQAYVMLNTMATEEGRNKMKEIFESMPPELRAAIEAAGGKVENMQLMPVLGNANDMDAVTEQIKSQLKAQGLNIEDVKVIGPGFKKVPEDSLTKVENYDGPLDLSMADEADSKSGDIPFFVMPNPNPDDLN